MLLDVITRVSADTGLDKTQKRSTLLQLANNAAGIMHKELECNKMYREVTLVVPPNKVVALPVFVGELRGMRMHTNELPFDLQGLASPRYISTTLAHKFKNWRDIGESAVYQLPSAGGPFTLETQIVEDVSVTISAETNNSAVVEEVVVMDDVSKTTTNNFLGQVYTIYCPTLRNYNISIKDSNGTEIAVLYNNQRKTRYKLVDVSQIFWTLDTTDGASLIDVLYKVPKTDLYRDSDSFYAGDDYDEVWYNLCMYLYYKPVQNRQSDAQAYFGAAMLMIQGIKESTESGIVKKLQFGRNKFYGIFKKYRYYPGSVTNVDHNIQG